MHVIIQVSHVSVFFSFFFIIFDEILESPAREVQVGSICYSFYDLGGHEVGLLSFVSLFFFLINNPFVLSARRVWPDYFVGVDAVCYVVDASDPDRFEEAKEVSFNFSLFSLFNLFLKRKLKSKFRN